MSNAAEIAALITAGMQGPTGGDDAGFHTGTILAWDPLTGLNSVRINNASIENVRSVQPGIAARYSVGDTVMIVRKQTQYFILGKVAAPGGAAGSAPAGNTSSGAILLGDTAGAWVDLPGSPGPSVTTYIGSNRAALVMWNFKYDGFQSIAEMAWEVSGANVVAPAAFASMSIAAGFTSGIAPQYTQVQTAAGFYLIGNSVLDSPGLTTFTSKFRGFTNTPAPTQCRISQRSLTVIPL